MVIECESCNTRFHLADGRISSKGARVRCSNCHHRFHVQPPPQKNASDTSAEHSLSQNDEVSQPSASSAVAARDSGPASLEAAAANLSAPGARPGPATRGGGEDADLDNPEFLFDAPARSTPEPKRPAEPPQAEKPVAVPSAAPPAEPEPEFERQAILREDLGANARKGAPDPDGGQAMLGFEPTIPAPQAADTDEGMAMLEVERGEASAAVRPAPSASVAASPSFEDVLAKELDEDDDDTMSGWDSLGISSAAPAGSTSVAVAPARATRSENILEAAHKTQAKVPQRVQQRAEPVSEAEYEVPHRRRGSAIVQAAAIVLGLIASAAGVRLVASHGVGTPAGPSVVIGAGWKATDIQSFHVQDLSRRRVLVLRGSLSADSPTPPPTIEATLLDSGGRIIGDPISAQPVRLPDDAFQPETVSAHLSNRAPTPPRERIEGFTVLIPDPPPEARRFYLDLRP